MKDHTKWQKIVDEILDKKTIIIFLLEQQIQVQKEMDELEIELQKEEEKDEDMNKVEEYLQGDHGYVISPNY